MIRCAIEETNGGYKIRKSLIPSTRSLFHTIKRFLQQTHIIWMNGISESHRLIHIDGFMKLTMQECTFDIQLMNRPRFGHSYPENSSNSYGLHHGAESLFTVHTNRLRSAITNKKGFMPFIGTIRFLFNSKNPH